MGVEQKDCPWENGLGYEIILTLSLPQATLVECSRIIPIRQFHIQILRDKSFHSNTSKPSLNLLSEIMTSVNSLPRRTLRAMHRGKLLTQSQNRHCKG